MIRRWPAGMVAFGLIAFGMSCAGAQQMQLDTIELPPGFSIHLYAGDVPGARSMIRSPDGTIFVGTRQTGRVYALRDNDDDYRVDRVYVIDQGLFQPNGVEFRKGDLYVAEVNRVLRYPNIQGRLDNPPDPVVVNDNLPDDKWHGWKYIAFGPNGWLYVPVGAPCNVCDAEDEIYATITRMRPDGSGHEIYSRGVRNTVGFDFHPETGELWFTDNGRDWMGDNRPPDELNHAPRKGLHFGFPHCHGKDILDPEFGEGHKCSDFTRPVIELGPHVAALGMLFYTGDMFPEEYKNQIFIAEHGSWNRSVPIGYRVMLVRLEDGKAVKKEAFAKGWLQGRDDWGRPVDVLQMPDGSLLVSDDKQGAVYRITYGK